MGKGKTLKSLSAPASGGQGYLGDIPDSWRVRGMRTPAMEVAGGCIACGAVSELRAVHANGSLATAVFSASNLRGVVDKLRRVNRALGNVERFVGGGRAVGMTSQTT